MTEIVAPIALVLDATQTAAVTAVVSRAEFDTLKAKYESLIREKAALAVTVEPPVEQPVSASKLKKRSAVVVEDSEDGSYRDDNGDNNDDEYVSRPKQVAKKPRKVQSTLFGAPAVVVAQSTPNKVSAAVITAKRKIIIAHLKTGIKAEKFWCGGDLASKPISVTEVMSADEFAALFPADVGVIAPSAAAKSVIEKRTLNKEDLVRVFGALLDTLTCTVYTKGGGGGRRMFGKTIKQGVEPAAVKRAEVTHSTNTQKAAFKFQVENDGSKFGSGDGDYFGDGGGRHFMFMF